MLIETSRLILRQWQDDDLASFSKMNACPRVMQHMPALLSRAESDAFSNRIRTHFHEYGYGLYAVDVKNGPSFIGFVGIYNVKFDAHFTPAVEIGWRISADHWGKGYAPEAAWHVLDHAFSKLNMDEIVSFTIKANTQSQRVMEKIGLQRDEMGDFDHPRLPEGHALRPHILYRLTKTDWRAINDMPDWVKLNDV